MVVVYVLQTTQNLVFSRFCFAEDGGNVLIIKTHVHRHCSSINSFVQWPSRRRCHRDFVNSPYNWKPSTPDPSVPEPVYIEAIQDKKYPSSQIRRFLWITAFRIRQHTLSYNTTLGYLWLKWLGHGSITSNHVTTINHILKSPIRQLRQ